MSNESPSTVGHSPETGPSPGQALAAWLSGLRIGEPLRAGPGQFYPLIADGASGEPYLLLHDAIGDGLLEVTERGSGTVNEVQARNKGSRPILVLEGECIVGSRQNRVVVLSTLIAAGATVAVPVGCVEHGRWSWASAPFAPGLSPVEPSIRMNTILEYAAKQPFDQGRLWSNVAEKLRASRVASPSSDYHAFVERHSKEAERRARAFEPVPGQVGVLAVAGCRLLGLELLGHPSTWAAAAPRLVPSYLLDDEAWGPAAGAGAETSAQRTARDWLAAIAGSDVEARRARGLGVQLALRAEGIAGAGLWHEGRPAHLAAFGDEGSRGKRT